jgi:hypothetical protein
MCNVVSKKCMYEGCITQPCYNFQDNSPIYCAKHKKEGMIDLVNKKCIHEGCNIIAYYNYENKKPMYCASHRLKMMINVKDKLCKTPLCFTQVSEKRDGYCLYCYINLFPDKPVTRNYKTKEYAVVEYIKSKFENLSWLSDKKIIDGCSKRRPDLFLDLGDQIIIVEIDENQHDTYDCSCENKRLMELSTDVGHRPIVFIRFNPDEYIENKNNIASCWSINNNGICVVKNNKKKEWEQRLKQLEETINYWLINRTDKTIEIIHLFYDSL